MSEINLKKISKIISKHTKVKEESVNLETSAQNTERWDSLAHINIIIDLDKEFNIKINNAKVAELDSDNSILQYLNRQCYSTLLFFLYIFTWYFSLFFLCSLNQFNLLFSNYFRFNFYSYWNIYLTPIIFSILINYFCTEFQNLLIKKNLSFDNF